MTQEDKELLLKDLSARLAYKVIIKSVGENKIIGLWDLRDIDNLPFPYLRSMFSMTEEEKKEMHEKLSPNGTAIYKEEGISTPVSHRGDWILYEYMSRIIDWLNARHFDYHGLIEKGLAIAVTEENNPYKE